MDIKQALLEIIESKECKPYKAYLPSGYEDTTIDYVMMIHIPSQQIFDMIHEVYKKYGKENNFIKNIEYVLGRGVSAEQRTFIQQYLKKYKKNNHL